MINSIKIFKILGIYIGSLFILLNTAFSNEKIAIEQNITPKTVSQNSWGDQNSDLPFDPAVTWGQLDNGLRYAIMPNQEPPHEVSLRLLVNAGSLMESENQRGLAHFLEHMSFKGGKNFPNQQALIEYFQGIGMAFGADTNAHTGLDQTVYKLELPQNTDVYLKDGFRVLRDFADGLLLNQSDIDSERGVILAEKRDGYTIEERIRDTFFEFAFPGTLLPHRFPIGLEEVIKNAPRERFVDFYKSWYTPDRLFLIVVGDVDPQKIIPLIKNHFGSMASNDQIKDNPDLGQIVMNNKPLVFTHNEVTSTDLEFLSVESHPKRFDTEKERLKKIQKRIAYEILNERLDVISKSENAPFSSGGASSIDLFNAFDVSFINLRVKPGKTIECVAIAEQELRRALQFGFTKEEMQKAIAKTLNSYEQAVLSAPKRSSKNLSSLIVSTITDHEVFTSPEEDLRLAKLALDNLTPQLCLELFKENWSGHSPLLFLTGNLKVTTTADELLEAYIKSKEVAMEAPKSEPVPPFAYKSFGEPGKIVEEKYLEQAEIYQYRFANNVRLNLKKTDFAKDEILISVQCGLGSLEITPDLEGINLLASAVFDEGGLAKHSSVEINRIFAGKTMCLCFTVEDNAFQFLGTTNNRDFSEEISLITAYMTDPGYRDEAFRLARHYFDELYQGIDLTPETVLNNRVDRFLGKSDYHFGYPNKDVIDALTKKDVIKWLSKPLSSGYLEISVVGDFEKDVVLSTIAKTFGALATRTPNKEKTFYEKAITFPQGVSKQIFPINSEFEKAICAVYWPTGDAWDIVTNRKLSLLATIFNDRIRKELREKLGEAYSPYAANSPSNIIKDYGRFFGLAIVKPQQAEEVANIILKIGNDIASHGVTEDEFKRALQPILHQIDIANRTNCYWLKVLNASQAHPEFIQWAQERKKQYQSFTPQDIEKIAKQYLKPDKAIQVLVIANKEKDTVR